MSSKSTMFTALIALAVAGVTAPTAHAQRTNRGELVSATAKLNQAQMALVKRLADDAAFADEFTAATSKGNPDAVADLVSRATGLPKSAIGVSGSVGGMGGMAAAETKREAGLFQLAARHGGRKVESPLTSGQICFDIRVVKGCISW